MSDIWPKKTTILVTMTALGKRFQAVRQLDPEIGELPEVREAVIRELKGAVLREIGKQAHWRIDVSEQ